MAEKKVHFQAAPVNKTSYIITQKLRHLSGQQPIYLLNSILIPKESARFDSILAVILTTPAFHLENSAKGPKFFLLFVYSLSKQGSCLPIDMIVCLQSFACKVSMQHTKSLSAEHSTGKTFLNVTYFSKYFVSVLIKQNIVG